MAGLGDGLVQEIGDSPGGPGLRPAFGGKVALQIIGVKSQADKMLTKPVVFQNLPCFPWLPTVTEMYKPL